MKLLSTTMTTKERTTKEITVCVDDQTAMALEQCTEATPEMPPTLANSFVQTKLSFAFPNTLIPSLARRISDTTSNSAFTIMLE